MDSAIGDRQEEDFSGNWEWLGKSVSINTMLDLNLKNMLLQEIENYVDIGQKFTNDIVTLTSQRSKEFYAKQAGNFTHKNNEYIDFMKRKINFPLFINWGEVTKYSVSKNADGTKAYQPFRYMAQGFEDISTNVVTDSVFYMRNILSNHSKELCLTSYMERKNVINQRFKGLSRHETREKHLNYEIDEKIIDMLKLDKIWPQELYNSEYSQNLLDSMAEQNQIPTPRKGKENDSTLNCS